MVSGIQPRRTSKTHDVRSPLAARAIDQYGPHNDDRAMGTRLGTVFDLDALRPVGADDPGRLVGQLPGQEGDSARPAPSDRSHEGDLGRRHRRAPCLRAALAPRPGHGLLCGGAALVPRAAPGPLGFPRPTPRQRLDDPRRSTGGGCVPGRLREPRRPSRVHARQADPQLRTGGENPDVVGGQHHHGGHVDAEVALGPADGVGRVDGPRTPRVQGLAPGSGGQHPDRGQRPDSRGGTGSRCPSTAPTATCWRSGCTP